MFYSKDLNQKTESFWKGRLSQKEKPTGQSVNTFQNVSCITSLLPNKNVLIKIISFEFWNTLLLCIVVPIDKLSAVVLCFYWSWGSRNKPPVLFLYVFSLVNLKNTLWKRFWWGIQAQQTGLSLVQRRESLLKAWQPHSDGILEATKLGLKISGTWLLWLFNALLF